MVYIHSKLMIIDDTKVIMGSANINDRSQVGYKDSEICMITEDISRVDSLMNGKPYRAGPFALGLRLKCWGDNLGLKTSEYNLIQDPACEATWQMMLKQSRRNTLLYESAFPGLIPTNKVTNLSQLQELDLGDDDGLDDLTVSINKKKKKNR